MIENWHLIRKKRWTLRVEIGYAHVIDRDAPVIFCDEGLDERQIKLLQRWVDDMRHLPS